MDQSERLELTTLQMRIAALVRDGREILASRIHAQVEVHAPYGGVVPELASRDHVRAVSQVVAAALEEAGVSEAAIDGLISMDEWVQLLRSGPGIGAESAIAST